MAAPVQDALLEWRSEFPTVEATLHFISHSLGAMPRAVEEALRQYAQTWKARGIRAWEESWMAAPARVADALAGILNAERGSISLHPNVTLAHASALSALDFAPPRNRLLCTVEDFPSVLYLFEGLARRGVEIVRVASRGGRRIEEQDVVAAIDERTAVVALSQVLFRTSQLLDLAPIVRRAREAGALTLIDAYQAVGTLPVDVQGLGVDMLAGGTVKWLCGGPGTAYLYVSPRVAPRLTPALTGWFAHERPFDFDPGPMRWDAGPRRFWGGTPGIPAYLAAHPGCEIIERIGVAAIRGKSLRLTGRMIAWADEFGWRLGSPREPERRGGTVCLNVPQAERVCEGLLASDVLLDHRPGVGLRLAPHFYTREDEVDLVMRPAGVKVAKELKIVREPNVFLVGRQTVDAAAVERFLGEHAVTWQTDTEVGAEMLAEMAGRVCYMSYGKGRKSNREFLRHIVEVGHGSVLEHGVWSFLITGVSRSFTHELIRHRHFSYSQLSQRYVNESDSDFIEPDAIAEDAALHAIWCEAVDAARHAYDQLVEGLQRRYADIPEATLRRKLARQAARSVLPNATETKIFVTGNARALRHFIELRGSEHADIEIRKVAVALLRIMQREAPGLFSDYTLVPLGHGDFATRTEHPKV